MVEHMIAIALLIFGIVVLLGLVGQTNRKLVRSQAHAAMAAAGQSFLESLRFVKWDENTTTPPAYTATRSVTLGPDTLESVESDFDDIDDYHGYTKSDGTYSYACTVIYVDMNDNESVTAAGGTTNFKQISVIVKRLSIPGEEEKVMLIRTNGGINE